MLSFAVAQISFRERAALNCFKLHVLMMVFKTFLYACRHIAMVRRALLEREGANTKAQAAATAYGRGLGAMAQ